MKLIAKSLVLFCVPVIAVSCGKQEKAFAGYEVDALDEFKGDSVNIDVVETELEFGNPSTIDFISDSLMIVFDTNANDHVAHLMNADGRYVRSFGRKGRGNGELIGAADLTVSENRDSVFLYDSMLKRMVGFDVDKIIKGEEQTPSVLQFDINSIPGQEYGFLHVECGADGQMLGFAPGANRIVTMKDGASEHIYSEYPETDPDLETNRSIWNYTGSLNSLSPDRKKLVVATYIGGLFEVFDVKDGKLTSRALKGFYKPEYTYAKGAVPKCAVPNPENLITGFRTVSSGNDDFVTVIDGPESGRLNEILTFDYDGTLKNKRIVSDGWVKTIGRNDNGEIYFFGWDKDFKNMNLYHVVE